MAHILKDRDGQVMPPRIGGLEIRAELNEIEGPSGTFRLEPQAVAVLDLLASEAGRVWSRDELMDRAWPGRVISDATLTGVISRLRRALAAAGVDDCRIETLSKRGYRLVLDASPAGRIALPRLAIAFIVAVSVALLLASALFVFRPSNAVRFDFEIVSPEGARAEAALWLRDGREGALMIDENPPLRIHVRSVSQDRKQLRLRLKVRSLSHLVEMEQVVAFGERGAVRLRSEDGQGHYLIHYVPVRAPFPPSAEIPQENRIESAGVAGTEQ